MENLQEKILEMIKNHFYNVDGTPEKSAKEITTLIENSYIENNKIKQVATDFFRYWWNTSGNNTDQGFDDWWKDNKKNYIANE